MVLCENMPEGHWKENCHSINLQHSSFLWWLSAVEAEDHTHQTCIAIFSIFCCRGKFGDLRTSRRKHQVLVPAHLWCWSYACFPVVNPELSCPCSHPQPGRADHLRVRWDKTTRGGPCSRLPRCPMAACLSFEPQYLEVVEPKWNCVETLSTRELNWVNMKSAHWS